MRFLRLLFWLLVALLALMFLGRNWSDVTIDLWGNLQADIKLPILLLIAFLVGLLPTAIGWRIRWWRHKRVQALARPAPPAAPPFGEPAP